MTEATDEYTALAERIDELLKAEFPKMRWAFVVETDKTRDDIGMVVAGSGKVTTTRRLLQNAAFALEDEIAAKRRFRRHKK